MTTLRTGLLAVAITFFSLSVHAQDTVTVGGGPVAEVPQFIVANENKLWQSHGVTVAITPFASGREAFEALIGGQLDIAIMAEFPAVVGAMRDQKFSVVSVLSRYKANRIIAKSDKPLTGLAEIAGRPVGVTIGTNAHFMLDEALRLANVKAETVNVGPADIVPALVRGDIAAAAPFPSFYAGARRTLGASYQELRLTNYRTTYLMVASADMIAKRPEVLAKFLAGLADGQKAVDADAAGSQEIVARVLGGASSIEVVKSAWSDYDFKLALDPELVDLMLREGRWIRDRGMIKNIEPTEALFLSHISSAALRKVSATAVSIP